MNPVARWIVLGALTILPYAGIGLASMLLSDGGWLTFFVASLIAVGVRLVFAAVETISDEIWWRLSGRKTLVEAVLRGLNDGNYPKPEGQFHDYFAYINRLRNKGESDPIARKAELDYQAMFVAESYQGMFQRIRYHSALNEGLRRFARGERLPMDGSESLRNAGR